MKSRIPDGGGRHRPDDPKRVVILGTDRRARELAARLERHFDGPVQVLGHVHLDGGDAGTGRGSFPFPVFELAALPDVLGSRQVDEVIASNPDCESAIAACVAADVPLTLLSERPDDRPALAREAGRAGGVAARSLGLVLKRSLDVGGAALGLLLVTPLIALAVLAIQLASPGAVVSRQTRCGLHGRRFTLLRLRTEATRSRLRAGPQPARSGVGRLVHDCGIDELLQLWNVLKGDMSLVGPRPPLPSELSRSESAATRRLSMRPGLTCLWQLDARPPLGADECAKLDLQYVDGWSLRTDLKILVLTVPAVLRGACD